jgi:hypothetical protein
MGLAAQLSLMPEYFERRAKRINVDIETSMRELGATWIDVRVHNLSTHGFMVEADARYPISAYAWLRLPGVGAVNAQIIWRDCFRYGCEFVTPLRPAECEAAIALEERVDS